MSGKYLFEFEFWQRNYDPFSFKHLPFSSIPALAAYTRLLLIRHIFSHVFVALPPPPVRQVSQNSNLFNASEVTIHGT